MRIKQSSLDNFNLFKEFGQPFTVAQAAEKVGCSTKQMYMQLMRYTRAGFLAFEEIYIYVPIKFAKRNQTSRREAIKHFHLTVSALEKMSHYVDNPLRKRKSMAYRPPANSVFALAQYYGLAP